MNPTTSYLIDVIRKRYPNQEVIPLHNPVFFGNEQKYVNDTIAREHISTIGHYKELVEKEICKRTGSKYCLTTNTGTAALHLALLANDISSGHEILVPSMTFVATCNAIKYTQASPHFIDVCPNTLGMCPQALEKRILEIAELKQGKLYNRKTKREIKACMPMHSFGMACEIQKIKSICDSYNLKLIEDAAEALGSYSNNQHCGTIGDAGIFSFNGNKIVSAGGGGAIVTNHEGIYKKMLHLSSTAKKPHPYEYVHDEVGYNYRMPSLNAAILLGQLENLDCIIENKQATNHYYKEELAALNHSLNVISFPPTCNAWLNTLRLKNVNLREEILNDLNTHNIHARPVWKPMHTLPMFIHDQKGNLTNTLKLEQQLINIPSSYKR